MAGNDPSLGAAEIRSGTQSPLGEFSDHPAHARFDIASRAARDWFAHLLRDHAAQALASLTL